jgi:plastocyanin
MLRLLVLLTLFAAIVVGPAADAATRTIVIRSTGLSDRDITIRQGDTVVWRNDDTANHQIVSTTGLFASPILRRGRTWSYTFQTPGTYRYRDALDSRERFRGVVRVRLVPTVSLASSLTQVVYSTKVMLTGQINTKVEGQEVQIVHQPYGQPSPIVLATVLTGKDGVFGYVVKPTILTTYQARWATAASATVQVEVAPRITLGRLSRWITCVYAGRSMRGKKVRVQRKTRFDEWASIKALVLGPKSCARFRLALPEGVSQLRVKMSVNQAGAGYLSGVSREVVWRRR